MALDPPLFSGSMDSNVRSDAFLKACRRVFRTDQQKYADESAKLELVDDYLDAGSIVERWFNDWKVVALSVAQVGANASSKTTATIPWSAFEAAFKAEFPAERLPPRTSHAIECEITALTLSETVVGTKVKIDGREVGAHIDFARKLEALVRKAGYMSSRAMITVVRDRLSYVLRELLDPAYTDWRTILDALIGIDNVRLDKKVMTMHRAVALDSGIAAVESPICALTRSFGTARISPPTIPPTASTPTRPLGMDCSCALLGAVHPGRATMWPTATWDNVQKVVATWPQ
jgi:hypothetical protein